MVKQLDRIMEIRQVAKSESSQTELDLSNITPELVEKTLDTIEKEPKFQY